MKVSVVVPMYNEESCISGNVRSIGEELKKLKEHGDDWELILVDDGSTDGTRKIAEKAAKANPKIKVVGYAKNRGRGKALRTGFEAAAGDIIVTTEADLTWGAEIISKMVSELRKDSDADMIIASPHKEGGSIQGVPFFRKFLTVFGNRVLGWAVPGNLTMVSGMTRAYRRDVIDSMSLENDDKEIHLEIVSKASALGYRIKEVPANLKWHGGPQRAGKPRSSKFNAAKFIRTHLEFTINERPILLLGTLGALIFGTGLASALYTFYLWATVSLKDHMPLALFTVLLLTFGVQLFAFCFLAYQNRDLMRQAIRTHAEILRARKNKK